MTPEFHKPFIARAAVMVPLSTALLSVVLALAVDGGHADPTDSTSRGPAVRDAVWDEFAVPYGLAAPGASGRTARATLHAQSGRS